EGAPGDAARPLPPGAGVLCHPDGDRGDPAARALEGGHGGSAACPLARAGADDRAVGEGCCCIAATAARLPGRGLAAHHPRRRPPQPGEVLSRRAGIVTPPCPALNTPPTRSQRT